MPHVKDILGHVFVEEAAGTRKCTRKKARKIKKGESCLVVKSGPMNSAKSYCNENAKPMLDKAWLRLVEMYEQLGLSPPNDTSDFE